MDLLYPMAVAWSKPVGEFRQADEVVRLLHPILLIDLKIAEIGDQKSLFFADCECMIYCRWRSAHIATIELESPSIPLFVAL